MTVVYCVDCHGQLFVNDDNGKVDPCESCLNNTAYWESVYYWENPVN